MGWPALLLVGVAVLGWQVAVNLTGVRPEVLPSPLRVLQQGWTHRADVWANTVPTLVETAVGFTVALTIGWVLAVSMDFVPCAAPRLVPLLVASQTVPIVAIAPLMIIWFGFGLLPKVLRDRARHILPRDGRAGRRLRRRRTRRHRPAAQHGGLAPSAVPLPAAARLLCPASSRRCGSASPTPSSRRIFAEYVGATAGLGIFMSVQRNSFRTDLVLAAVLVTALLSRRCCSR